MLAENMQSEEKFNLKYGPTISVINPTNKLKNKGISINAKGIRTLKLSSKVKELVIHETPVK